MSHAEFSGSIPETYRSHMEPLLFVDFARDLAQRIRAPRDGAVLETACGSGVVTRQLRAKLHPTTRLVATDLNEPMFRQARLEIPDTSFIAADACDLPFDDASFDAVACQFGVMFFPDRVAAYRQARRVLRPGGSFTFSVWDDLDHSPIPRCIHRSLAQAFPDDPPGFFHKPHSYHDLTRITRELQQAGFTDHNIDVRTETSSAPGARDAATAFIYGSPLASDLIARDAQAHALDHATASLEREFGPGPIQAPMQAFVITAPR